MRTLPPKQSSTVPICIPTPPFRTEIHLNLLAKDPHNTAIVGFDPNFCKYMPLKVAQQRKHLGNLGPRRYYRAYVQEFMDEARHGGYLVAYVLLCLHGPAGVVVGHQIAPMPGHLVDFHDTCWAMAPEEDVGQ